MNAVAGAIVAAPLTDNELARIPTSRRDDPAGLSRAAKSAYAEMRRFARGGDRVWVGTGKLAEAMGNSDDTTRRARDELLEKGWLEVTEMRHGRRRVYRLRRDPQSGVGTPQLAVAKPQNAGHIEELRTRESAPRALSLGSKNEAAASPAPPGGGSAAAEKKSTISPADAEDRAWIETFEWTPEKFDDYAQRARVLYERFAFGIDAEVPAVDGGPCDECGKERRTRYRFGSVGLLLCGSCRSDHLAAAMRLASQVVEAEAEAEAEARSLPPVTEDES